MNDRCKGVNVGATPGLYEVAADCDGAYYSNHWQVLPAGGARRSLARPTRSSAAVPRRHCSDVSGGDGTGRGSGGGGGNASGMEVPVKAVEIMAMPVVTQAAVEVSRVWSLWWWVVVSRLLSLAACC
jgi:hypothetical protein